MNEFLRYTPHSALDGSHYGGMARGFLPSEAAVKAAIFVRSPDLVAYKGTKGRFLTWKKIKKTAKEEKIILKTKKQKVNRKHFSCCFVGTFF